MAAHIALSTSQWGNTVLSYPIPIHSIVSFFLTLFYTVTYDCCLPLFFIVIQLQFAIKTFVFL